MYYSAETGGFYDSAIHGDAIPKDAVGISAEDHATLMAAQAAGQVVAADVEGRPIATDPPAPTEEQMAATARARRDGLITGTDWLVQRHREQKEAAVTSTTLSADQYTALLAYRQALRDVPEQAEFPGPINWPEAPACIR